VGWSLAPPYQGGVGGGHSPRLTKEGLGVVTPLLTKEGLGVVTPLLTKLGVVTPLLTKEGLGVVMSYSLSLLVTRLTSSKEVKPSMAFFKPDLRKSAIPSLAAWSASTSALLPSIINRFIASEIGITW